MEIGDHVIYVDTLSVEHDALVTAIWSPDPKTDPVPSLNVVYVSKDGSATDQYGRQLATRACSVVHESKQFANGQKWRVA